jgi:hypothetical protein
MLRSALLLFAALCVALVDGCDDSRSHPPSRPAPGAADAGPNAEDGAIEGPSDGGARAADGARSAPDGGEPGDSGDSGESGDSGTATDARPTAPDAAAVSLDGGCGLGAYRCEMVQAHNTVRANPTPTPVPPLEPLGWDDAAEAVATGWAMNCVWMHNPNRGNFGENIAATTAPTTTPTEVTNDWASEAADYDYANNSCTPGKECGHYTQIVWRTTNALGCYTNHCTTGTPFSGFGPNWTFTVCDYSPPGNWIGEKPY